MAETMTDTAIEINPRPTRFQVSVNTQQIYDRLRKTSIGEEVTYAELSRLIAADTQTSARSNLESARRMLQKEHIVFGCIHGEGLRRLNDPEIVSSGDDGIKRIRRMSQRTALRVVAVKDFDALPDESKKKSNVLLSVLGALRLFTRPKSVTMIENKVADVQARLDNKKMLALFANGNGKEV